MLRMIKGPNKKLFLIGPCEELGQFSPSAVIGLIRYGQLWLSPLILISSMFIYLQRVFIIMPYCTRYNSHLSDKATSDVSL